MSTKKPAATASKTPPAAAAAGAFAGLNDMMTSGGLSGLGAVDNQAVVELDVSDILIKDQDRKIFEDEEQTIESLWKSIQANGQIQPIVVRPIDGPVPFELVVGERRLRSCMFGKAPKIFSRVIELTDEQAYAMQTAENIDRLNLTLVEEAKSVQRKLTECGGDVEKLMAATHKSRAWISKRMSVLNLTPQAARIIAESISADVEVILNVAQVEKANPEAAKALVDDLKKSAGKPGSNAREKSQAAKTATKGPTKAQLKKQLGAGKGGKGDADPKAGTDTQGKGNTQSDPKGGAGSELSQMEKDLLALDGLIPGGAPGASQELAGQSSQGGFVDTDPDAGNDLEHKLNVENVPALAPQKELNEIYDDIFEHKVEPKELLKTMLPDYRDVCENWLHSMYDAGVAAKDLSRTVVMGFRNGQFSSTGHGALSLAAFLYGADSNAKFNLQNVFASIKE